ncbi:MAG: trypsin-like peptidase domain-containing protein [Flaviflexus sp.]|nr:trypsin-like peptidase domain-containing protein [Flaviflexus sp.]
MSGQRGSGRLAGALALLFTLFVGAGAGTVAGREAPPLLELAPLMLKDGSLEEILEAGSAGPGAGPGQRVIRADGIVLIWGETLAGPGAGTGMIITPGGLVLTNYHVVADTSDFVVEIVGERRSHPATMLGFDATHDVALLQLDELSHDYPTVHISERQAALGDPVAAIGNGSGAGHLSAVAGRVTGLDVDIDVTDPLDPSIFSEMEGLIRTDADVVPGYSGGPLINGRGEVIGITSASSFATEDIDGYAVPIKDALNIAGKIVGEIDSDDIVLGRKPALGITYGMRDGKIRVIEVHEGSAAEQIGLAAGDIITEVDGTTIVHLTDLSDIISAMNLGDSVTISWIDESGQSHRATAVLSESKFN